jgi:hypothetical protein
VASVSIKIKPDPTRPLPDDFESEEPTTFAERVKVAAATAKMLLEAGAEIPVSTQEKREAEEVFRAFTNPETKNPAPPVVNKYLNTPATVQHLYMMLSDYDHQVVQEAVQLRRYVTNKLIEDTNLTDPRHRLRALELLGKISDVGLFSDKTEVTVKAISQEDLESQIRTKLFKILGNNMNIRTETEIIDAEIMQMTPEDLKDSD